MTEILGAIKITKITNNEVSSKRERNRERRREREKSRGVLPTNWKFNELEQRERAFRTKEEED